MDSRSQIPSRLRLTRDAHSFAATVDDSRFHATGDYDRDSTDSDDDGSTPKLALSNMSIDSLYGPLHFSGQAQAQSTPAPGREGTPAERLRQVMKRSGSATPMGRPNFAGTERPRSPNGSLLESESETDDFETPRGGVNGNQGTPFPRGRDLSPPRSAARSSLKSLFDRALRGTGDTPEKPRRTRRGSMDSSIAEESPIKWSMLRAEGKAKRMSLSDDEREEIRAARSGLTDGLSEKSFKSSVAMNYDQLRERLENSGSSAGLRNGTQTAKSDMTIDMEEATEVEQELLIDRDYEEPVRSTTPPAPLGQSVSQFPSQFMGSNLLGENSDVHRMLQEAETDTTDSEAPRNKHGDSRAPVAGPSSKQLQAKPSVVRERTLSNNSSIGSLSPNPNSRPISRQSMNGMDDVDRNRERERMWNHPLGSYMERHRAESSGFSPTQSGGFARVRKTSLSSISSASSDGRGSPVSKRLSDPRVGSSSPSQIGSRYTGMGPHRAPSVSPNQIRVGPRSRTTSQPSKPSSPRSLGSSTGSNGTQKPIDRSRTVSLTARPSSSLAHARSSPAHGQNGTYGQDPSGRPDSPTSSRSSSRASSHAPDEIKTREQNWNATRPKWNSAISASSISERRRSAGEILVRAPPPAEHTRRSAAVHQTSSSPSSIPRPTFNGRAPTINSKQGGMPKDKETNGHAKTKELIIPSRSIKTHESPRYPHANKDKENIHTSPITNLSNTLENGRKTQTPPLSSRHQPNIRLRNGHNLSPPHGPSPPSVEEFSEVNESEEHDTPKIGPQPIPGSPTRSVPNGHAVTSSGFSTHGSNKANGHMGGSASTATSVNEKEYARKGMDHTLKSQPPKNSVLADPIEFHDSDLDSFQEEDIAASSSAPRVHNGRDLFDDEDDSVSQEEQSRADVSVLRPRQKSHTNGHEANSTAKRHSSVPANFSPPPSPPLIYHDPVTTTPQRRTAANVSKVEFKTPSPPKGMPALPDPPSSDDGESDRTPPVSITPANRSRFADMKTPRPPGAWGTPFVTPAPALTTRLSSGPREKDAQQKPAALQDEVNTPPASYSNMTSTAMKTPALPGGWVATPATIAAKRLQKVRFDPKDVATASATDSARDESSLTSDSYSADGSVAMKAAGKEKPPSPRTPGRIRVMDAYGNEITPVIADGKAEKRSLYDELHTAAKEGKPKTSDGRKSRIRVLDAMGNEIEEVQVQPATSDFMAGERTDQYKKSDDKDVTTFFQGLEDKKLERRQALVLLQKTIAGFKDDFIETDDPANAQTSENVDSQIADLKAQSIRAREDRERLLQKIRDIDSGDRSSQSTFAWSALYSKRGTFSSHRVYLRAFVALLFLQFVLFLAFYRLTSMGARRLYLTTYVDPFYPELHLHITNPDILQLSMEPPERSDAFTSVSSSEWMHSFLVVWYAILDQISSLRETVCDLLRDTPRGVTWPPT